MSVGFSLALVLGFARPSLAHEDPAARTKWVLFLDSFGRDFSPYAEASLRVRTEIARRCGHPIEFFHVSLQAHGSEPRDEQPVADYVEALCSRRVPDLVVTIGGPAARFFTRYRERFGPSTPVVHGGADPRWLEGVRLSPQETAVVSRVDLRARMENVLLARPRTREVVVVSGASPTERFWVGLLRREWQPFATRVRVTFLDGLSFDEIMLRCEALPPESAIFVGLMILDAAGIPHEQQKALERLRAVASAPVFGWASVSLGHGIVGGRLLPIEAMADEIAAAGVKALHGIPPSSIPVKTVELGSPIYDARELERWAIDERTLPPGSEVRFREPSFFSLYRGRILGASAVILLQTLAIVALVEGRRRQRRAEQEAARLRGELAHAGRVSVMGQLAASIAHELAQPLGAMLRNAEAAELYLGRENPDLAELRAIVADIKSDDQRARDVIERMRGFLRRHELVRVPIDPAELVDGVLGLVRPDAWRRDVKVELTVDRDLPPVAGDPVHLQQVLLNLSVNALDAMEAVPAETRVLEVRLRAADGGGLEISVRDSGPGIPAAAMPRLFEPFFTTKAQGMGMGLAICRTLVEAHGGSLLAANGDGRGAVFVVRLPEAEVKV
ncbi:MAG: ATPase [Thermoanaerobaculia bacterium]|nr:ATPase [Thermoanaerobaculia bacterium]